MRFLWTIAITAGLAGAQCYTFTGPAASFSMNVLGVLNVISEPSSVTFSVQQQTTFTYQGSTYTGQAEPGTVGFAYVASSNLSSFSVGADNNLSMPFWTVAIAGEGLFDFFPSALPTAFPPVSAWNLGPIAMNFSFNGGPVQFSSVTSITSCSATGSGSPSVSGKSLGDTSGTPGSCNCDDPIDLGSGNLFQRFVDYQTAGANKLSFIRYYNSLGDPNSLAMELGKNWRSNFDRYLRISPTSVVAERPEGAEYTFTLSGSAWTTDSDVDVTLTNSGNTWTLVDKDDTVETYTAAGAAEAQLQTIQSRNGYTQTMQYNGSNQLTAVTDSYNRQLVLLYQGNLLQSVQTPDSLTMTFGFTGSELASVRYSNTSTNSSNTTQSYVYENTSLPSALTGIIDENETRYATWTYDANGRVLTGQRAGGADLTTIVYNDGNGGRMVTNPLGEQETYSFSTMQNVPKLTAATRTAGSGVAAATRTITYDSNGYVASVTDWNGNLTTFVNNAHGEPTTIVEASGTAQSRTTTISYHPSFHLPTQVVTPGLTANFTYDNNGELLTKTLTDTTTSPAPYATNGQTRTWTLAWSNFLLASVKGPRTDVNALTKFTYDSSGALTSVANAFNQTTQIVQHLPGGLPLNIVDANGVTTNRAYDARQRLLSSTVTTSAGALTTSYAYDAAGNLITVTQPDGSAVAISYDGAHRVTSFADLFGQKIQYMLDAAGDRTQLLVENGAGAPQVTRSTVFDPLGRATKYIGGAGQVTTRAFDSNGNMTTFTDPLNHAIQIGFDALNRPVKTTNAASGVTALDYDPLSRPLTVADPNGATTQYIYDGFGDVIEETSPARGTTVYRYDTAGNVTQKTDARGVVANYSYDALNRLSTISYPGNTGENVSFGYDEGSYGIGRLTSVTDAAGSLSRSYDQRGNVLSETRSFPSASLTTSYTYDAASRIASITYPSQWKVVYTRDMMGRITAVTATPLSGASQTVVSGVAYQPFGGVNALTYGNGIAETRAFDPDYRLVSISAPVQQLAYNYDGAGRVLGVSDGITAANSQTFAYDGLNRLISASGPYGSLAYSYDANGNRLTETSAATGDGLGSIAVFTYNQAGRLATASTLSQQVTQYTYDGFGHRVRKTGASTGTTLYQYDSSGRVLEESDGSGNPQVDYIYLDGRPVAAIQASSGEIVFLHTDRLGAPVAATNASQSVVWSTTYQPFGAIATAPALIDQNLRLPGQESDLETGLYHNGFRDYVPAWGRYLQSDPIGLLGGNNTYSYVSANPLGGTDTLGLCEFVDFLASVGASIAGAVGINPTEAAIGITAGLNPIIDAGNTLLSVGDAVGSALIAQAQQLNGGDLGRAVLSFINGAAVTAASYANQLSYADPETLALGAFGAVATVIQAAVQAGEAPTGQGLMAFANGLVSGGLALGISAVLPEAIAAGEAGFLAGPAGSAVAFVGTFAVAWGYQKLASYAGSH